MYLATKLEQIKGDPKRHFAHSLLRANEHIDQQVIEEDVHRGLRFYHFFGTSEALPPR